MAGRACRCGPPLAREGLAAGAARPRASPPPPPQPAGDGRQPAPRGRAAGETAVAWTSRAASVPSATVRRPPVRAAALPPPRPPPALWPGRRLPRTAPARPTVPAGGRRPSGGGRRVARSAPPAGAGRWRRRAARAAAPGRRAAARAGRRAGQHARDRGRRPAQRLARARRVPDGRAQPRSGGPRARCSRRGARVGFAGSELVWQHYAGQGIQLQWLGTFGDANALFTAAGARRRLARAARRGARPRRAARRRDRLGVALPFGGGAAAMGQRTGAGHRVQALSRAAIRLGDPDYSARRARRSASSAPRRPRACASPRRPAPTTSSTPSPRGCTSSTGSCRRSTACYDFAATPTTPRAARCSTPASASCAPSCRPTTPARGRCYRPAREADLGYHALAARLPAHLCERRAAPTRPRGALLRHGRRASRRYLHAARCSRSPTGGPAPARPVRSCASASQGLHGRC